MPPKSTPAAAPLPPIAPQMPSALLRSAPSSNASSMIDSAAGETIAAPTPCTARARDQHADRVRKAADERREREKIASPIMNIRLPAEQVGRAPAEQQEAAEGDRVRADHPLQVAVADSRAPR